MKYVAMTSPPWYSLFYFHLIPKGIPWDFPSSKYTQFHRVFRTVSRLTACFTRAAGLVKELLPQEQLQARVAVDLERR
jgi:hypothetical protein